MNISVYATNTQGEEAKESDRLLWYPNLIIALEAYIALFNNLPQIGIELLEDDNLDAMTIKGIIINPISKNILVHFEFS